MTDPMDNANQQNQTPPQPIPQTPAPQAPENQSSPQTLIQKHGRLKVFIVAVIIVAIMEGLAIYFLKTEADLKFFSMLAPTPTSQPSPVTKTSPTQAPATDATTHTFHSLSLQLPQGWKVNNSDPALLQLINYDIKAIPGRDYNPSLDKGRLKIEIYTTNELKSVDQYIKQQKAQYQGAKESWKEKSITVAGQPAMKVESIFPGFFVAVQDPATKRIFSISFGLDFENNEKAADQILSTLKFTE